MYSRRVNAVDFKRRDSDCSEQPCEMSGVTREDLARCRARVVAFNQLQLGQLAEPGIGAHKPDQYRVVLPGLQILQRAFNSGSSFRQHLDRTLYALFEHSGQGAGVKMAGARADTGLYAAGFIRVSRLGLFDIQ